MFASCTGPPDFFYPFGEDVGDTRLHRIDDGSSEGILLNTPIVFYGKSELLAFVRREVYYCTATLYLHISHLLM